MKQHGLPCANITDPESLHILLQSELGPVQAPPVHVLVTAAPEYPALQLMVHVWPSLPVPQAETSQLSDGPESGAHVLAGAAGAAGAAGVASGAATLL